MGAGVLQEYSGGNRWGGGGGGGAERHDGGLYGRFDGGCHGFLLAGGEGGTCRIDVRNGKGYSELRKW